MHNITQRYCFGVGKKIVIFLVLLSVYCLGLLTCKYGTISDVNKIKTVTNVDKQPSQLWKQEWKKLPGLLKATVKDCTKMFNKAELAQYDLDFEESWNSYKHVFKGILAKLKIQNKGHVCELPYQMQAYYRIARLNFIRNICETGFDTGHSSVLWLTASPKNKVFSFDSGETPYTKPAAAHIQKLFPTQFDITFGDSTKTIPEFVAKNPNIKCDLLVVHGGRSDKAAKADLKNMFLLANPERNIIVFDDYPYNRKTVPQKLEKVWKDMKEISAEFKIKDISGCINPGKRMYSVGTYEFTGI